MNSLKRKIHLWFNAFRWFHWGKGLWVFLVLLGRPHNSLRDVGTLMLVFLLVSLLSSAIYINNDINDREKDSQHPTKKYRPFASGELTITEGRIMLGVLLAFIGVLLFVLQNWVIVMCALVMLTMNYVYTVWIKKLPYIELLYYGPLSTFRYWMGAAAIGNPYVLLQTGFVLFSGISSLSLLRYMEKTRYGSKGRELLTKYSTNYLQSFVVISTTLTILFNIFFLVKIALWLFIPGVFAGLFLARLTYLGMQKVSNPEEVDDIDKMIVHDVWLKVFILSYLLGLLFVLVGSFR